jgi:hypothetical protein
MDARLTARRSLWRRIGEAKPDEAMEADIPSNPIRWALSLVPGSGAVSAFGGGYFDDAGAPLASPSPGTSHSPPPL